MFKTSRNRNSVKIVLDFTGFLRILGNNSAIPFLTAAEKRQAFLLLRRLRLLPLPKSARRHPFSALAVPAPLPHVGATSGFESSGGYALGWAAKAAQTADTGATGCDWRFGCAINLCFQ